MNFSEKNFHARETLLTKIMIEQKLNKSELARRMSVSRVTVNKIFKSTAVDLRTAIKFAKIMKIPLEVVAGVHHYQPYIYSIVDNLQVINNDEFGMLIEGLVSMYKDRALDSIEHDFAVREFMKIAKEDL